MRTIDRSEQRLTGWSRATSARSTVIDADADQIPDVISAIGPRGAIARGLGRSYGDPALNSGGEVIRVRSIPVDPTAAPIVIDESAGPNATLVTANAGVTIGQLIDELVPLGYFVPVTPGTRLVTVGGAIASDIHGKNHHLDGSFANHVQSLRLALADGSVTEIGPTVNAELFWATVGGMGLTGVVLDATFAVLPIETSRIVVESRRIDNLDEMMAAMIESERNYRYSVAWLDILAKGRQLGRGVLTDGYHAARDDLTARQRRDPLYYSGVQRAGIPNLIPPTGVINRATVAAFNEAWYRRTPATSTRTIESIPTYFHPLDAVGDWNRVYGRSGLLQYQVVVPLEASELVRTIIAKMSDARLPSFLTVLKRFGPGNPGMLSFPIPGWTLAVDVSTRTLNLGPVLRELDELVIDAGGRHYLAKDHLLTPGQIRRSYPRLGEWQRIRHRVDPTDVWTSDQSRRLRLTDDKADHTA